MKFDLPTNATVVDEAIRFVSSDRLKYKPNSSSENSNQNYQEESNEPHYDEDKDQLREKWRNDNNSNQKSDVLISEHLQLDRRM
jgi:chaperone required for assembly of F1-ATPase